MLAWKRKITSKKQHSLCFKCTRWVPCVAAHLQYGQPMWDPQIYNRGISMGPMCGIPPSIWAAYVGPSFV